MASKDTMCPWAGSSALTWRTSLNNIIALKCNLKGKGRLLAQDEVAWRTVGVNTVLSRELNHIVNR
jgi:hypothetical protein